MKYVAAVPIAARLMEIVHQLTLNIRESSLQLGRDFQVPSGLSVVITECTL